MDYAKAIRELLSNPGRPTAPPLTLFDMRELAPVPGVVQQPVPAYTSGRPMTELASTFESRKPIILRDVHNGLLSGADQWYYNEPIRQQFISELGDEAGNARFKQWANLMGANSNSAPVRPNVRKASLYMNYMDEGKLPLDVVHSYKDAVAFIRNNKGIFLPEGYGSVAQATDLNMTLDYARGLDRIGERGAPLKIQNFIPSIEGNLGAWTGDRHVAYRFGVPKAYNRREDKWVKQVFPYTAYPRAEQLSRQWAAELGIDARTGRPFQTGQFQPAQWIGGAQATGVKSLDPSLAHAVEQVMYDAALRTGELPKTLLKQWINGRIVAVPGAIGAGAAMSGDTPADEEQY